jgi:hypothetical protein
MATTSRTWTVEIISVTGLPHLVSSGDSRWKARVSLLTSKNSMGESHMEMQMR